MDLNEQQVADLKRQGLANLAALVEKAGVVPNTESLTETDQFAQLFADSSMNEEFISEAKQLFESAVDAKVSAKMSQYESQQDKNVSAYLEKVVNEWVDANANKAYSISMVEGAKDLVERVGSMLGMKDISEANFSMDESTFPGQNPHVMHHVNKFMHHDAAAAAAHRAGNAKAAEHHTVAASMHLMAAHAHHSGTSDAHLGSKRANSFHESVSEANSDMTLRQIIESQELEIARLKNESNAGNVAEIKAVFDAAVEGLSEDQIDRAWSLVEDVEFTTVSEFRRDIQTIIAPVLKEAFAEAIREATDEYADDQAKEITELAYDLNVSTLAEFKNELSSIVATLSESALKEYDVHTVARNTFKRVRVNSSPLTESEAIKLAASIPDHPSRFTEVVKSGTKAAHESESVTADTRINNKASLVEATLATLRGNSSKRK